MTHSNAQELAIETSDQIRELSGRLRAVNEKLWEIEDEIRLCEREEDFGEKFMELARSVYRFNDEHAGIKREINTMLGAQIVEEKSYADY